MDLVLLASRQGAVWHRVGAKFVAPDHGKTSGMARNYCEPVEPLYLLPHPVEGRPSGWSGQRSELFPQADDAFEPYCLEHLLEWELEWADDRALPPGGRVRIAPG